MSKYLKYKWCLVADNDVEGEIVDHLGQSGFDVLWAAESRGLSDSVRMLSLGQHAIVV